MSRNFVVRAAFAMVAVMCALVVLEGQADACFKFLKRNKSCCESSCETTCCETVSEPSCGCPAVEEEPSCGCPEPSCGCEASCDSGCKKERKFKLFGRRNKGCESSCESSCGCATVEPSCGAPADDAPAMEAPPAPEAST